MNPVFVYGILKGRENAEKGTVKGFRLIDMGSFPAAIPSNEGHNICGELIFVDDDTITRFDMIEGAPSFYRREKVEVDTGQELVEAEMYVVNESYWEQESSATARLDVDEQTDGLFFTYHP